MGLVQFNVSEPLLRLMFGIPGTARIERIFNNPTVPDCFTFYVESKDFPDTPEGALPTPVIPTATRDERGNITLDFNLPVPF